MTSGRVPEDLRPNRLALLLEERRARGEAVLDLTSTNPTTAGIGGHPAGLEAALADPRVRTYEVDPRGIPSAREAVAAYLASRVGNPVSADRVYLTASTSEAYAHLFRLLCDPGDEVLIPRPCYPLLDPLAHLEDVRARGYRLVYDKRWRLDIDSVEAALGPRTRAVVVIEPNNPTGSCLSPQEHGQIESICRDRNLALIADEVFGDIAWPPRSGPLPSRLTGRTVPTFVLGGISKPCGLPQLKLGWIAVDGPERALEPLAHGLEWILDLFLSVGTPVQWALPKLLFGRHAYQAALGARLAENLSVIDRAEAESHGRLERYQGEGGLSAIVRFDRATPAGTPAEDFSEWALRSRGVYAHPAHFYDLDRGDVLVLSLLTQTEILHEALERLLSG